jgi:uncharacterized membrane protein
VLALALGAAAARAQQPQTEAPPLNVYRYSGYKTLTYETVVRLSDLALYRYFLAGASPATGLFMLVNVASASGTYYVHELLWNLYGRSEQAAPDSALSIGLQKLLFYRAIGTARNLAVAYLFTGNPTVSLTYAAVTGLWDSGVYGANEYLWYRYGPPLAPPAPAPPRVAPLPMAARTP